MTLIVMSNEDISSRLIDKKVFVSVRSRCEQKPRNSTGRVLSVQQGNQGLELHLDTGSGPVPIVEKIYFCGLHEAISSIAEITNSGGHEGIKPLYYNQRVDKTYTYDPSLDESKLAEKTIREIILSQGHFP